MVAFVVARSLSAGGQSFPSIITTVAGGLQGSSSALASPMRAPGVAVDSAGNIFIADQANSVVRKIDGGGNITTVAGNNSSSFSGDNGPATAAGLNFPSAVFVNGSGDLFISDTGNNLVRRVDHVTQIITTVAGGGTSPATCAGSVNGLGDGCSATSAILQGPVGIAVDGSGVIFIADVSHNRIRRVDPGGIISTFAGGGAGPTIGDGGPAVDAILNAPVGIALDGVGNLFIADSVNNLTRKVDPTSQHIITTVAGGTACPASTDGFLGDGCLATQSELTSPTGVFLDSAGNLFIADKFDHRIRKVDQATQIITTIAGGGISPAACSGSTDALGDGCLATQAVLSVPQGVAVDGTGNVFIADFGNNLIRKIDTSGIITPFAGNGTDSFGGDNGPAIGASLSLPFGVSVNGSGDILIADQVNNRVRKVDSSGTITTIAGGGTSPLVCPGSTDSVGDGCLATQASLQGVTGVTFDANNRILIAGQSRIRQIDPISHIITAVAGGGSSPGTCSGSVDSVGDGCVATQATLFNISSGVTVDANGDLLIPDSANNRVRKVDHATQIITTIAGNGVGQFGGDNGLATGAQLNFPSDVVRDAGGNLYIADSSNNRIRKVNTQGTITTVAGGGSSPATCSGSTNSVGDGCLATEARLDQPFGVALDSVGNVLIADHNNNRIRRVDHTTQVISTLAGTGIPGFSGDNGLPAAAQLHAPSGVFVDGKGNLFIADEANNRIREVATFPVANPQSRTTLQDTPLSITLAGASPRGNVALSFTVVNAPSHGSLNGLSVSAGTVTYTPASAFTGSDSFSFKVNDGNADSAPATVTVSVNPPPPDFTIVASPPSASIKSGQSATFSFTVTPQNGFNGNVSFSCSGLPLLSTCTFTPATVTANGGPVMTNLVVKTTGPNATLQFPHMPFRKGVQPLLGFWASIGPLALAGVLISIRGRKNRHPSPIPTVFLSLFLLIALASAMGCGGGGSGTVPPPPPPPQTPAGTSTVTVTASTNGGTSHVATVSITVTQ